MSDDSKPKDERKHTLELIKNVSSALAMNLPSADVAIIETFFETITYHNEWQLYLLIHKHRHGSDRSLHASMRCARIAGAALMRSALEERYAPGLVPWHHGCDRLSDSRLWEEWGGLGLETIESFEIEVLSVRQWAEEREK